MDNQAAFEPQAHRSPLQQLMGMLRAPTSEQQQLEIQALLQANPALMAAFIRQRERAMLNAIDRKWEKCLKPDERNQLINVISSRIHVTHNFMLPGKAMVIEGEAYKSACSREEYYRLLAEMTRHFESELEEKHNSNDDGVPNYDGKSWQKSITSDRRIEVVLKIVQAIFPNPNPAALRDARMNILIAYARKVEVDMYNMAATRGEYHRLIAEKIYKIQVELKKKWRQRRLRLRQ